ncbi:3733_t:CDS:2 [Paraglomus brasilianum]|uniref:3733_t:CDS:1 n=1 Tax=Paraglomus brasilianum TaxID=144538 RepID=A0A9N9BJ97_9GLOM|nr:3733_t:CDS:2 [Paraglomus brasilianum]
MSYYAHWYEQSIRQKRPALHSNPSTQSIPIDASQPDVTAAQVTVCSLHNRLVYNLEFKPCERTPSHSRNSSYTPEHTNHNERITHSQNDQHVAWKNAHEMVYNRTSDRERTGSSQSTELLKVDDLIDESLWDDWIVKFINNDEESVYSDDKPFEDWIFDAM